MRLPRRRARRGFTLIELIVVIGIIIVIATMAIMFLPNLDRNKGVPNAVTQLHGWLNLSKQTAVRDKSPRGVRLYVDPSNSNRCTSLQYIEQPEPFAPTSNGSVYVVYGQYQASPTSPVVTTATLYSVITATPLPWESVAVFDFLEISTVTPNVFAAILGIDTGGTRLILDRNVTGVLGVPQNKGFRVFRASRPLMGEPALQIHKDVYIDLSRSIGLPALTTDPNTGEQYYDILFNSSGFVGNTTSGQIFLVVGHVDRYDPNMIDANTRATVGPPGECLILAIYTRTGRIAPYSINDTGTGTIYDFARTGESPGL